MGGTEEEELSRRGLVEMMAMGNLESKPGAQGQQGSPYRE